MTPIASAGVAVPVGGFGDIASTGFIGLVGVRYQRPGLPVAARAELLYHRLSGNEAALFPGRPGFTISDDIATLGLATSLAWTLSDTPRGEFYVIGGVGLYRQTVEGVDRLGTGGTTEESTTRAGFNLGAGVERPIGRVNWFVEARLHRMFSGDPLSSVLPITVGLRF